MRRLEVFASSSQLGVPYPWAYLNLRMVLRLPDKMVMRSFTSFLLCTSLPTKKNVFSSCSVRLALHVHRRKLCRFWPFRVGPHNYNYVPAVLKLPTSSPPHGIDLDPPGGLRPIFFILYLSSTLTIFKSHLFFLRPQCPKERVNIPIVRDTK